ncbi:MAG: hypothetical protein ACP5GI_04670 [Sulfolobales archaeon]
MKSTNLKRGYRELVRVIEFVLEQLFYSVFVGDDNRARHTPLLINLSLVATIIYLVTRGAGPWIDKVAGLLILLAYVFLERGYLYLKSMIIITMVPTTWYVILAFIFRPDLINTIDVLIRVFTISLSTLLLLQLFNPVEITWIINRIGFKSKSSLYPQLLWRISPHMLKDLRDSLIVNKLKNTEIARSIAVGIIVFDEYADFYEEGLISRDEINSLYWYDCRETIKLTLLLAASIIYLLGKNILFSI